MTDNLTGLLRDFAGDLTRAQGSENPALRRAVAEQTLDRLTLFPQTDPLVVLVRQAAERLLGNP